MNCVEGYEKNNVSSGSYACEADGKWSGEKTVCIPKDCGAPSQVKVGNFVRETCGAEGIYRLLCEVQILAYLYTTLCLAVYHLKHTCNKMVLIPFSGAIYGIVQLHWLKIQRYL